MATEDKKTFTLAEVKAHNDGRSCWLVIHDQVYDVTKFLEEHPGGEEVLLEIAGQDGTEQFEDVGHSEDARSLLKDFFIGDLDEKDISGSKPPPKPTSITTKDDENTGVPSWLIFASIMAVGIAVGCMFYMQTNK